MKPGNIELKSLRVFITFCESLNMSKAAEALNLTQPAISHHLALLEEQFNTKLIDREVRPMTLTKAGKILYERGLQNLADINTTVELIMHRESEFVPKLKLGIAEFFSEITLPLLAKKLGDLAAHLHLETNKSSILMEKILNRDLDIIISGEGLYQHSYLKQSLVYKTPLIGIYNAKLKKISKSPNMLTTLIEKKIDYIEYLPSVSLGRTMKQYLHTLNYSLDAKIKVDSLRSTYTFVTLLPAWGVTFPAFLNALSSDERNRVISFDLPEPIIPNPIYIFFRNEYEMVADKIADILKLELP